MVWACAQTNFSVDPVLGVATWAAFLLLWGAAYVFVSWWDRGRFPQNGNVTDEADIVTK